MRQESLNPVRLPGDVPVMPSLSDSSDSHCCCCLGQSGCWLLGGFPQTGLRMNFQHVAACFSLGLALVRSSACTSICASVLALGSG